MNPVTKPIISFCLGSNYACAVFFSNQMKCWGAGTSIGTTSDYGKTSSTVGDNIPYFDPGSNLSVIKVACQANGLCVLLNDSTIKCVGANNFGQGGIGVTNARVSAPTFVGNNLPAVNLGNNINSVDVISGVYHNCALTTANKLKCFGNGINGQLGYEDPSDRGKAVAHMGDNLPYIDLGAGVEVMSVHSGSSAMHTCVVLSKPISNSQKIKCWGFNNYYQLGYGDTNNRGDSVGDMGDNLLLVDLGAESKVKQLGLGEGHTCAILVNDILKCFGYGNFGQLGSGSTATISSTGDSIPSVSIDIGKTIIYFSTGEFGNCIIYNDVISMKCFGSNEYGQLGQGDIANRGDTPLNMIPSIPNIDLGTGSLKISSIHSGMYTTCVVFENNSVKCFGFNSSGQLAIGSTAIIGNGLNEMGSNLQFSELFSPTTSPTYAPSLSPTPPTYLPSRSPSNAPSAAPTKSPSSSPTKSPTLPPTLAPTRSPSLSPTSPPSLSPTRRPTRSPTSVPTAKPTKSPSQIPTKTPTNAPTTSVPSTLPTRSPSPSPSRTPTNTPTRPPTLTPSKKPSHLPTILPTSSPTQLCDYRSAKICKYDYNCMWINVDGTRQCVKYDCSKLNQGKCAKQNKRCKWNKKTLTCNPRKEQN